MRKGSKLASGIIASGLLACGFFTGVAFGNGWFVIISFLLWTPVSWYVGAAWANAKPLDGMIRRAAAQRGFIEKPITTEKKRRRIS